MSRYNPYDEDDIRRRMDLEDNPPDHMPGQGDGAFSEEDLSFLMDENAGGSDGFVEDSFAGVLNPNGNQDNFGQPTQNGNGNNNSGNMPSFSSETWVMDLLFLAWEATKIVSKGLFIFSKTLIKGWKSLTPEGWYEIGYRTSITAGVFGGITLVAFLLSFLSPNILGSEVATLFNTSVMVGFVGVTQVALTYKKKDKWKSEGGKTGYTEDNLKPIEGWVPPLSPDTPVDLFGDGGESSSSYGEEGNYSYTGEDNYASDFSGSESQGNVEVDEDGLAEPETWSGWGDDIDLSEIEDIGSDWGTVTDDDSGWGGGDFFSNIVESEEDAVIDYDAKLQEGLSFSPHTQTRAWLFERFSSVMRTITPTFSELVEISKYDNSEVYVKYQTLIANVAHKEGIKDEPILELVRESPFLSQLALSTGQRFKAQPFMDALLTSVAVDDLGRTLDGSAMVTNVQTTQHQLINLIKGNSPNISVKDAWYNSRDFFLDTDNIFPVSLGSNEFGEPINVDLEGVNSIIIEGGAGMGKTWIAESIITQLCFFNSPKNVNIIIADVKGKQGDFDKMNFPQITSKISEIPEILKMLHWLLEVESKRRLEILGRYNLSDIKDLHRYHPEVDMPYLYIFIEELMSVVGHLSVSDNKSEAKFFEMAVREIISRYRYIGVRLFTMSVSFKNVLEKKLREIIDLRLNAGGDAEKIGELLGFTNKKLFPYDIGGKRGRYALRSPMVNSSRPSYLKATILSSNNVENKQLYEYVASIWNHMEPEYAKYGLSWGWVPPGSVKGELLDIGKLEAETLNKLSSDAVDLW